MQCQSLFLCVCKHLFCYIYVVCMHVQMNAAPAFVWQPRTPVREVGVTTPHVVVLNHEQLAPPFSTSKDILCNSCQAEDKRQQMYGVMPLQCSPPESQRVPQVPCFQNTAPGQCMPIALDGNATTPVCDNNVVYVLSHHAQNNTAPCMSPPIMFPVHSLGGGDSFLRRLLPGKPPKKMTLDGYNYKRQ
jgi:hypothetical protein